MDWIASCVNYSSSKTLIGNLLPLAEGFFLSSGASYWKQILSDNKAKRIWRPDRGLLGYGIVHHASGYRSLKRTLVHYKDNHKTNLIIVAYNLIYKDGNIKVNLISIISFQNYIYMCATKMLLASPLLSPAYLPGHPVNRTDIFFLYCSMKMWHCAMYSKATTMTHAPINALTHSSRGYLISLVTSLSFRLYFSSLLYVCKSFS